jgi:hypothetical protein
VRRALHFAIPIALLAYSAVAFGSEAKQSAASDYRCRGAIATLVGTAGDDRLVGTPHDDVIVARGGDDLVLALGGDDKVCDNGGHDHVVLGSGDDEAGGGDGSDHIEGGSGDDWLAGRNGNDRINGGRGADRLIGELGNDTLGGEAGNDNIGGGPGTDHCSGGPGRDRIRTCERGEHETRPDRPPAAANDSDSTSEVTPKDVPVLLNDVDPDGDPLRVGSVDATGTTGSVTVLPGGTGVRYDPGNHFVALAPGESASDSFKYSLAGGTAAATVMVTIAGVDTGPSASGDGRTVIEDDVPQPIDVLANDTDPDGGEAKSIFSVTQPPNGTVAITGGGSLLSYEPEPDYCNSPSLGTTDNFTYKLAPGGSAGTVAVTVTCVNDDPQVSMTPAALAYSEGVGAVPVDEGLTTFDIDSASLSGATVGITTNFDGGEDVLAWVDNDPSDNITLDVSPTPGTIALTGSDSPANYDIALRSITYENTSDTPSTLTRTVSAQITDSSSAPSNPDTRDIEVAASNDPPVLTTSVGNTAVTEDGSATVDTLLEVADADDTDLESAQARVSVNFQSGDALAWVDNNLTDSITRDAANSTPQTLILTGHDTNANYRAALRAVTFGTTNDDPSASKTVEFKASDGTADSNTPTKGIAVTGLNDAPALSTTGTALAYGEGAGPVAIDPGLTATDPDSGNLQSATVSITGSFTSGEDSLQFTNQLGITGNYNSGTGVLTLTGPAGVADFQAALRTVAYQNNSENPSSAQRTVSIQATDSSAAASNVATRAISVGPANDAPVVTASGGSTSYTEGDAATTIDGALTVTDADDTNLEGAVVRISAGFESGDQLVFVDQSAISGVYNTGTGVLTLSGTDSKANYQTALRSVNYRHTGDNPADVKTVEFTANDGDSDSNAATKNLAITRVNDGPTITTTAANLSYEEGDGAVPVDGGLTLADPDSAQVQSATVSITNSFESAEDALDFTDTANIDGTYNSTTGVLTLTGSDTKANYQTALRSVTYENTSTDTPVVSTRTVSFQAKDAGGADSNVATRAIAVGPTNDAPVVTTSAGSTAYNEGAPATVIDSGVTVTDVDDTNIETAVVGVSANFQSGDVLAFTNTADITGSYNSGTGVLALTGSDSRADYEAALQSITFASSNTNPSASKTIEFKANDGDDDSNAATKTISVVAANSPPAVVSGGTLAYTENDPATAVHSGLSVTEPEGDDITGGSASVTSGFQSGEDTLAWVDNNGADNVTIDSGSTAQTITLTGVDSAANYEAALRAVTYVNSSENPATTSRTVTFSATDEFTSTGTDTRTIAVASVDDAPVAANDGATVPEDASATSVPVLTNDTDVDGGTKTIASATDPANGTVVPTGGSPGAYTGLTYQPDPNYCNDPPGTSLDTFDYTLAPGGSTATVSMTVTCVNDAPVADPETFNANNSAHGNTTMVVDDPTDGAPNPSRPKTTISGDILAGDTDVDGPGPLTVTPGTFATNDGGSVTVEFDGDFTYEPKASTSCTDTSDFFDYTVEDSGSPEQTDTAQVTIAIAGCVWYVDNNHTGAPDDLGTSQAPFDTLADAETASGNNHTVFVFDGDNATTGYDTGYAMDLGERLIGEDEGLVVDPDQGGALTPDTLYAANPGAKPTLTANNEAVVALDDGNELRGFNVNPDGTGGGIAGDAGDSGGGTIDDVNIVDAGTASSAAGLVLNGTSGTFNITDFTYDNTGVASSAPSVELINAGTVNFGAGDAGDPTKIAKTGGPALKVLGASMGTSAFDEITVADSATGAIDLTNITAGSSTTFGDGSGTDLSLTTTSGSAPALNLSSAAGITIGESGIDNISATGGPAITIASTSGGTYDFDDVSSTSSAGNGISLGGLGSGTFSADPGAGSFVTGATGTSFSVSGASSGSITYPGNLNNGPGQAASVTGRTGGAVSLSGQLNDSPDAGGGILLSGNSGGSTTFSNGTKTIDTTTAGSPTQNNALVMNASDGHTLRLTGGGLDIDTTTGRGLHADASGTIEVSGSGNTIDSTTGRALEIANTDIAATGGATPGGVTFQKIASNAAPSGITLNTTGSGPFAVTGNGGTCTSAGTCTGGAIQSSTASGIALQTVPGGVDLTRMSVNGGSADGIHGDTVSGFALRNSSVTSNGDAATESGVEFTGLTGTVALDSSTVSGSADFNVAVVNDSGALNMTVTNGTYSNTGAAFGNDGIMLEGTGSGSMTAAINGTSFSNNKGDHVQITTDNSNTVTQNVTINGTTMITTPLGSSAILGGGITVSPGGDSNVTANITNNDIQNAIASAITVDTPSGSAALPVTSDIDATIDNNTIGTVATGRSGSYNGNGMMLLANGNSTMNALITDNLVRQYSNKFGILLNQGDGTNATMNATLHNNTLSDPNNAFGNGPGGIHVRAGLTSTPAMGGSQDAGTMCLDVGGAGALQNWIATAGLDLTPTSESVDMYVWQRFSSKIQLPFLGGTTTDAAAKTYLANRNNGNGLPTVYTETTPADTGFQNRASGCPLP